MEMLFKLIFCGFALQKWVWTSERLLELLFYFQPLRTQKEKFNMRSGPVLLQKRPLEHLQLVLPSYPNLPSQKATLSIIPYHFTTHPTSQNSIFSPILFKYSILSFFYYFSFSISFPLFLPQPLADQHRFQHRATHTHP